MTRLGRALSLLLLLSLSAGCSGRLPPFETAPPALRKGEDRTLDRVAVCYNALTASAAQLRAVAADSCGPGTRLKRLGRDFTLENCPLLQPERVTFACIGGS